MKHLTTMLLAAICLSSFGSEIRVRPVNGVPQIHVDGVAVRPRWFWGGPSMPVTPIVKGEQVKEIILLPTDFGKCETRFHFRFARKPLNVWIDDFEVIDITDNTVLYAKDDFSKVAKDGAPAGWTWFPQDEHNTVGKLLSDPTGGRNGTAAMKIEIRNPQQGSGWPDFHVYSHGQDMELKPGHTYKISMWIKSDSDNTLSFMGYRPASPNFIARFCNNGFEEQVRLAMGAGVDFISPSCVMPWPKPGETVNWQVVDIPIQRILAVNPHAKIVPRISMRPPNWWFHDNPDEIMQWQENKGRHLIVESVSSLKWRHDASENLARLIRHLDETFPDAMAGYHPAGQNTSEWFYQDSWGQDYHGYSPCEQQAFRRWLAHKYKSDSNLQAAWNNHDVSLETASVPTPAEHRNATVYGMLLIPQKAQKILDFNIFLQDEMTDAVKVLAQTVREASNGRKLSVFFYGYGFEFSGMNRMSACGHLNIRALLNCPDIDILCSPISYFDRQLGGGGHSMTVAESVLKAGKLWLYEDDSRTYLARGGNLGGLDYHAADQWESRQILVRNTAQEICRNLACWWMDLMRLGWYKDPLLWKDMKDLAPMEQPKLLSPVPYNPPVACIFDETSAIYTIGGRSVTASLISLNRKPFSQMGAAYGQYLLDDVINGKVDSKLAVLLNPWVLTSAQRQQLKNALKGKFAFWCHAPGIIDADSAMDSLEASANLTGFTVMRVDAKQFDTVTATEQGKAMKLPNRWNIAPNSALLLAVKPAVDDTVLATWPDGTAAVVLRDNAIFCASPAIPVELLRLAANKAGVHLYTDTPCVFYTDNSNFVFHAPQAGAVTLRLPFPMRLMDAMTRKPLTAAPVSEYIMDFRLGETKVLSRY